MSYSLQRRDASIEFQPFENYHREKRDALTTACLDATVGIHLPIIIFPMGMDARTTDFNALLEAQDIDIIDICTPPHVHRDLIEKGLASVLHVICEKPLMGSLADIDAIAVAEQKSKSQLFPIFQYRFGHGLQKLKHLQAKGFAHTPFVATIETSWRRNADYYAVDWRGKWATELGGVLSDARASRIRHVDLCERFH
ncbi:Gfo/Idh/MocA family protein [Pseudomonas frederiksbergensis]|uniref:Gfo/Idh/MocA family protein n=1 Tax=Pseudomonas frederiksbergensis TaxID=104087 RepID=UPI000F4AC931|nr:Gfo/Idh/MocA family oxidoreductase [Pseudomonas frederiksbergensis]